MVQGHTLIIVCNQSCPSLHLEVCIFCGLVLHNCSAVNWKLCHFFLYIQVLLSSGDIFCFPKEFLVSGGPAAAINLKTKLPEYGKAQQNGHAGVLLSCPKASAMVLQVSFWEVSPMLGLSHRWRVQLLPKACALLSGGAPVVPR